MISLLFISFLVFLFISLPVAVCLGFASLVALYMKDIPLITVAQSVFESLDSFALMAVPFFILAGNLMQTGGMSRRLINLANVLVGWFRGGLGSVAVLTSMFFATISGSSSATTAAVGSTLIPAMEKKGYPKNFATATCAASGELGVIIPPSIPMVIYGLVANVSVGSLFLAGFIPGLMIGLSLILTIIIVARVKGYDVVNRTSKRQWLKDLWKAFADSALALLMPFIILGGIYKGWFTPTEASVIAVVYGFAVGMFVYREIKWKDLMPIFAKSSLATSVIMMIVAYASIFGYILTIEEVPQKLGKAIAEFSDNPIVFLLLVNVFLFIAGTIMEALITIIIVAPILAPIALQFGIDPVHFGIIMVVNVAIGMLTPPVAVNLVVACQIAKIKMSQLTRPVLLYLGILTLDVLIISYVPAITTWLPSFMQG
ncbi:MULTISPECIES: TRAP transporter large permease [unclassified Paenibacillus]|uniref:TRAP transporter large permease n=1 Tax=unclassified Paenibacillus TaxID=185978 RepID=UPI001AE2C898|nr:MULTISPECIES: TRAP transporter large permease [unclassified Paenibacillus]MBP1153615.1 C4-dicarboxylate transporter DctM subunit [Paenibacillus sp. PvP091]MBP1171000.1 C4-dicarboxylate transporter DctM subunit [Paenibacillus sp. PvR098]MBP2442028.1 C4-dicarboxylate transporter DctM subunit [Paenibacillus sp. PvP052]